MGKLGFKLVGTLIVIATIFFFGFFVGGSFSSGLSFDQMEPCLPAQTVVELANCVNGGNQ